MPCTAGSSIELFRAANYAKTIQNLRFPWLMILQAQQAGGGGGGGGGGAGARPPDDDILGQLEWDIRGS